MFDYSHITSRIFEEIAKVYLEEKYPTFKWELTSSSGDGNKDVICNYKVFNQEQEYWAEAKFTPNSHKTTLTKGQLDPTLISALLSNKTVSICFISNNCMTSNYLYRLEDFRIKTNIGITLVLKDEFERWILERKDLQQKYQIKLIADDEIREDVDTKILSATVTDVFNRNQYKVENDLLENTIYYLYIIINSSRHWDHLFLKVDDEFQLLSRSHILSDPKNLSVESGRHIFKFELLPLTIGRFVSL